MSRRETTSARTAQPASTLDRLVTVRELTTRSTLSRSTIWRKVQTGDLPPPIQLTPTRIAWRESQIVAWLDARTPVQHDARHMRAGA